MQTIATKQPERLLFETETSKTYGFAVSRYQKHTAKPLNFQTLSAHLETLKALDYAPATVALDFQALSKAILDRAPSAQVDKLQTLRRQMRRTYVVKDQTTYAAKAIEAQDVQTLIDQASERLSLIIETLAETGLRVSELCSMKLKAVDKIQSDREHTFFKVIGKGNKSRTVFIPTGLVDRIKETFGGKVYLFETVKGKAFNRTYISRKVGELSSEHLGKRVHPHTLRHSFITNEIKAGTPIDALSLYVGHADKAFTVKRYSHNTLTPELRQVRFRGKK